MHIRKKPFAIPELNSCGFFTDRPDLLAGHWREQYSAVQPLHLELGCGKAVSTAQMVLNNPNVNYVAIDLSPDILGVARRNIAQAFDNQPIRNIMLVRWNIDMIDQVFSVEDEIERIYINFCNPWTKRNKQAKKRLTSPQKLMMYRSFLKDGAKIYFKTDNDTLFQDSLTYFEHFGFEMEYCTDDLHASGFAPNYESEHERLYTGQGVKIKFAIVRKLPGEISVDPKRWLLNYHKQDESTLERKMNH